LFLILLVGLVHGLLYTFLIPPWQHYDEPNHFEYIWLIAQRGKLPQPDDFDPAMRRAVAEAMIAAGFFRNMGYLPDLNPADGKVWIGGYSQLGGPPLYYLLAALPLWVCKGLTLSVTKQLYLARLVSLGLYLFTLLVAWQATAELTRPGNPLRWLVPLTMALLPAFTDVMTSVNDDVGAVAVFSLFLWVGLRLVRDGFSWRGGLWAIGAALLCLGVKTSVWVALPLLLPLGLLAILRGRALWLAGAVLVVLGGLLIPWLFLWQATCAYWYPETNQTGLGRLSRTESPVGEHVFMIESAGSQAGTLPSRFRQLLSSETLRSDAGQVLTLGAWMWASQPVQASSPRLHVAGMGDMAVTWSLTVQPTFHAFTVTLPSGVSRAWVDLVALTDADQPVQVYADGLVLADGVRPLDEPPTFDDADAQRGRWGAAFENRLHGASAEGGWPAISPQADLLSRRLLPDQERLSLVWYTVLDSAGAGAYYRATMVSLVQTFWARFGWGHVPLANANVYGGLGWLSLLAGLGAAAFMLRQARRLPWPILIFLGLSLVLVWGSALVRGAIYSFEERGFIPVARYAFPVIFPTILLWGVGCWTFARGIKSFIHLPDWWMTGVYGLAWAMLDVYALVSIVQFYA
jgi:hypothetical protein